MPTPGVADGVAAAAALASPPVSPPVSEGGGAAGVGTAGVTPTPGAPPLIAYIAIVCGISMAIRCFTGLVGMFLYSGREPLSVAMALQTSCCTHSDIWAYQISS